MAKVFEASGVPNHERVQEAIHKASLAVDTAKDAVSAPTSDKDRADMKTVRDRVRGALQLVLVAERTFNEEVDRKVIRTHTHRAEQRWSTRSIQ